MQYLFLYENLIPIEALLLGFIITYVAIPSIVDVSQSKHLYDVPNGRTSHEVNTPTLGGLAIFAGFIISTLTFIHIPDIPYTQYVIAGIIVVFFIGIKDDIIEIAPMTKFIGQLIAATIIVDLGGIRLAGLYGFFGITDIGYYGSDLLTIFVIIAIVNAFNLIDGIDGLASGVGIIASVVFGIWFYQVGQVQLAILSFALIGSLLAFFRFNVFSKKRKIFMGDIGSLLLGFIMAIFAIKFNEISAALPSTDSYKIWAAPAVSVGILIVPIYDTIRIFILRLVHGRPPFHPDKKHVHHYMLELTGSHTRSTFIILSVNIVIIVIAFLLSGLRIYQLFLIIIGLATIASAIPYYLVKRKNRIYE